jgi:general secretion pathway protein K
LARLLRRRASGISVFDGLPETWRDGAAEVEIAIVDEAGKIDLNEAPLELLSGLFVAVGRAREEAVLLACNVLEWRGTSVAACPEVASGTGRRAHGRFVAPEQLGQVAGFDEGLYREVSDSITVVTRASAVDPLVAARPVLMAIPGATAAAVDSFLEERARWRDIGGLEGGFGLQQSLPFVMISPAREFTITATAATGTARYRADLKVRLTGIAARPYEVLAVRAPPVRRPISVSSRTARVP